MEARDVFANWTPVREGLIQARDQLNDEQLGFSPRDGLWSIREVACHIADAEDSWLRCARTETGVQEWPRSSYLAQDFGTVEAAKELLASVHAETDALMSILDTDALDRNIELPWGASVTVGWILWHALEHEVHHRGEIYLMLGLVGMEAPDV